MRRLWGWLVVGILIGLGFGGITAQATDTAVTTTLPPSMAITGIFNTTSSIANVTNTATLVANNHGLQITEGNNHAGSAWATNNYKVDLSKDATFSLWLYLGKGGAGSAGQGMTFVLQNAGTTGFTTIPAGRMAGQSLGTWGLDFNSTAPDATTVAAAAIPKSWALEFDEQVNDSRDGGDNNGFDYNYINTTTQHIASNYPAQASTYSRNGTATSGAKYFYFLNHQGKINTTLSDGTWHHLTLAWTASTDNSNTGSMTYTFNDKNPTTGASQSGQSATISLDLSKLGINVTDATKTVTWGFTGVSGTFGTNNVVAFEHIPGLVNAQAKTTITDETLARPVTADGYVNGGDTVSYRHQLTYVGGSQSWQNIVAQLPTIPNVTWQSGTVTYADGSQETLPSTALSSNPVTHVLTKSLSSTNTTATLQLTGRVAAVTTETPVADSQATFAGTNQVMTSTSPNYTIYPARQWSVDWTAGAGATVAPGSNATITGLASVAGEPAVNNHEVTVHASLNGQPLPTFTLNGTTASPNEVGAFTLTLPADKLISGTNSVTVYVTDSRGNRSATIATTVMVAGKLAFSQFAKTSSFVTTILSGQQMLINRNPDWQVQVQNSLGTGTTWQLTVQASELTETTTQRRLAGEMVWCRADGTQLPLATAVQVAQSTNTQPSQVTDITGTWQNTTGIRLHVSIAASRGNYHGQLTWTLTNSPG